MPFLRQVRSGGKAVNAWRSGRRKGWSAKRNPPVWCALAMLT